MEVYIGEVGEASSKIELTKLTAIREFRVKRNQGGWIEDLRAKIITKSGNQLSVRFKDPTVCFGGKLDLGYVKVRAADVKLLSLNEAISLRSTDRLLTTAMTHADRGC